MNFTTISRRTVFIGDSAINSFHSAMFHGVTDWHRPERISRNAAVWNPSAIVLPLRIFRTIHNVPPISMVELNFVVNGMVADQLANVPHTRLLPVEFERLVDISWHKNDQTWIDSCGEHDAEHYLRTLPDVSASFRLEPHFEFCTRRLQDVTTAFPEAAIIEVEMGPTEMPMRESIKLSKDLLREYPVVWNGGVIASEVIYDRIAPYLDADFFVVRSYQC